MYKFKNVNNSFYLLERIIIMFIFSVNNKFPDPRNIKRFFFFKKKGRLCLNKISKKGQWSEISPGLKLFMLGGEINDFRSAKAQVPP